MSGYHQAGIGVRGSTKRRAARRTTFAAIALLAAIAPAAAQSPSPTASRRCRPQARSSRRAHGTSRRGRAISSSSPACAGSIPRPTPSFRRRSAHSPGLSQHEADRRIGRRDAARLRAHRRLRHRHVSVPADRQQGAGGIVGQRPLPAAHHRRGAPPQPGRHSRSRGDVLRAAGVRPPAATNAAVARRTSCRGRARRRETYPRASWSPRTSRRKPNHPR